MDSLYDLIDKSVGEDTRADMGRELGIDQDTLGQLLPAATALMTGAMARQAGGTEGAASLDGALARDHDGSILELGGTDMVRAAKAAPGDGILKHILGGARGDVEQAVGDQTGLGGSSVSGLLTMLAPIVLGALGNMKQKQGLGAGDLAGVLGDGRRSAEAQAPSGLGGMLGRLLDSDGDGDTSDDIARIGKQIFGNILNSGR